MRRAMWVMLVSGVDMGRYCSARELRSEVRCRVSDIRYRISDIGYRISDIGYRISDIRKRSKGGGLRSIGFLCCVEVLPRSLVSG